MTTTPQSPSSNSTDTAYETVDTNQDTKIDRCNNPPRGDEEGKNEVPCPLSSSQVCLPTPPLPSQSEEEVYEVIPGENN